MIEFKIIYSGLLNLESGKGITDWLKGLEVP